MTIRAHRFAAAGALAVAGFAAPIVIAFTGAAGQTVAGPACLAWFGNKEDGICLSRSNSTGGGGGTPEVGFNGRGITTGPLLPGQTWNTPMR